MRRTHFTVMLVCEGDAEDQCAQVIRDLYLPRNCGTTMRRKNAFGYGGAGALKLAIALQRQTAYDAYGVLVDTDQHWDDAQRALAMQHGIVVVESVPCLEAVLLAVDEHSTYATTVQNKAAFQERYGAPANRDGVIRRHFPRAKFDAARSRVRTIESLLRLIRC